MSVLGTNIVVYLSELSLDTVFPTCALHLYLLYMIQQFNRFHHDNFCSRSRQRSTVIIYIYWYSSCNSQYASSWFSLLSYRSRVMAIWKFHHENSGSRSRPRLKVMSHIYDHQPKNSYGLGFVVIRATIPELWLFQYLTLNKFRFKVKTEIKSHDTYLCTSTQQFIWSWFGLNESDGSWVMAIWIFDLENSGSRSRPSSTVMTLIYEHCHSDSYRLGFVSIRRIVNELLPFDHLTLTIWGHSYDWDHRSGPILTFGHWPNDSYGLGFILIRATVPQLWPFEYLTLKI